MPTKMKFSGVIYLTLICLFFLSPIYGQRKTWNLYTFNNEKYTGVVLSKLENDALFINVNNRTHSIKVDSIKSLRFGNKSYAPLFGTIAGILAGGFLANQFAQKIFTDSRDSGLKIAIGSGIGMVLGGIVGYNAGKSAARYRYKSYDIYRLKDKNSKIKLILKLIKEN